MLFIHFFSNFVNDEVFHVLSLLDVDRLWSNDNDVSLILENLVDIYNIDGVYDDRNLLLEFMQSFVLTNCSEWLIHHRNQHVHE